MAFGIFVPVYRLLDHRIYWIASYETFFDHLNTRTDQKGFFQFTDNRGANRKAILDLILKGRYKH